MSTCVLHELRRRGATRLWMASDQPDLFLGNPDVDRVIPKSFAFLRMAPKLGINTRQILYPPRRDEDDRSPVPQRHLLALMCQSAGITGEIALRPYLHLTDDERAGGRLAQRQIAIMSSGLAAQSPMRNKDWYPERFQQVVDALVPRYTVLQLGSANDFRLADTVDLRGKTSFRESAAILSRSLLFIGLVGFLMHLARAVDCRSVIVFGGREAPWQSGYAGNENLYSPLECAPCWLWNTCPYDRRCMHEITSEQVIAACERQLTHSDAPLPVDTDILPDHDAPAPAPGMRGQSIPAP